MMQVKVMKILVCLSEWVNKARLYPTNPLGQNKKQETNLWQVTIERRLKEFAGPELRMLRR